jgi:segregation and condensation protein A
MDDYRVRLPVFDGPLDLLLYLVKKNEVDVRDIPVALVAEQFREYLAVIRNIDVEAAGDFLVTAATLLEIKSRMLLPRPLEPVTADAAEDPRRELVQQLLDYRKYKEAAGQLQDRAATQGRRLPRGLADPPGPAPPGQAPVRPVELWDLVSAFGRILHEAAALAPQEVVADDTPQHVYLDEIRTRLVAGRRLRFRDAFTPPYHRLRLIGLFLAILELMKSGEVRLEQGEDDADIWLMKAEAA